MFDILSLSFAIYCLVLFSPVFPYDAPQDAETVGRVLTQIDKCNGYILGAHDIAEASRTKDASRLFRTAFSETHEPMFEKVGSVQERYMPNSYGSVPPELVMNGVAEVRGDFREAEGTGASINERL